MPDCYDPSGSLVTPATLAEARGLRGGLARVEDQDGKTGYIELLGNSVWREKRRSAATTTLVD